MDYRLTAEFDTFNMAERTGINLKNKLGDIRRISVKPVDRGGTDDYYHTNFPVVTHSAGYVYDSDIDHDAQGRHPAVLDVRCSEAQLQAVRNLVIGYGGLNVKNTPDAEQKKRTDFLS
ncbi:MAG: hypothetical protein QM689_12115 [Oscillospiraceae bacterium]